MGRKAKLAFGLLALLCRAPSHAYAQAPQTATRPAQIDRNGTLILIRSTLIALQQANETGNYTVLRDLGAPGFRQANNAARLGDIFANLRSKNIDLAGVLVLDPQLSVLPQVDNNGMMHIAGVFPSVPVQINFELAFAPVDSRWRLFGISVGLGSSSPVAPSPPPAPAAAPAKPQKFSRAGGKAKGTKKSGASKSSEEPKPKDEPKPKETTSNSPAHESPPGGGATLDH